MSTAFLHHINWLAVLVATLAYFILGAIWYSALFGKKWIAYHNIDVSDPNAKKGMAGIMVASFLLMAVSVTCLAILRARMELADNVLHTVGAGLRWGLLTGAGFAAAAISIGYLYTKKHIGLHLIDGLFHICGYVAAMVILCMMH